MKKIKVAIYSGVIPSTTFIENLIKAVSSNKTEILLFGVQIKPVHYRQSSISIFRSPEVSWRLFPFVFYNLTRLRLYHADRYKLLKTHIDAQNPGKKQRLYLWSKYLPVVINLPDIFHLQWAINCNEWMFLKNLFNVKILLSLRGAQISYKPLADPALQAKYEKTFPEIDAFHAVSGNISKSAIDYKADFKKIRVIYSGIDLNLLTKYQKIHPEQNTNRLQILSVGRMHWNKGYHFALDALKKLSDNGFDFHYTIIAGLNAEEILYQIQDLQLNNFVTLYKSLPQETVFEHMRKAHLLLLPSFEEGVANVVLEAMAVGLPVLSSDCGGMPEVITHNENGYLYRKRDSLDLQEKLMFIFNSSAESRMLIAEKAKNYVMRQHTLEILGSEMELFYSDIMNPEK